MIRGDDVMETELQDEDDSSISDKETRLWGSKTSPASDTPPPPPPPSSPLKSIWIEDAADAKDIPFVFKTSSHDGSSSSTTTTGSGSHNEIHHQPPQGFQISSRVYTDPNDKLAHFDNDSAMVFPYWECGVSGSTTVPIPLQHATVRYLLGGSQPTMFSGAEFGPYPQLLVALSPLEVSLDSGQTQIFAPGDVILLEDTVSPSHKLKGVENKDMTVMILTLTEHYHQVGKDKTSLTSILNKDKQWKISPCPNGLEFTRVDLLEPGGLGNQMGRLLRKLQPRSVQRYILSVLGLSASTILADFFGKVAPLWLAVLFGGGCFVAGGTVAFVKVGDKAIDEFEMWKEQRQLRLKGPPDDKAVDDEIGDHPQQRPEGVPQVPLPS